MSDLYLGLDASKGYSDFMLLDAQATALDDGFQLDDTPAGHEHLHQYLLNLSSRYPEATIYVAVESTGGYENNWYRFLKSLSKNLPLHVARLNPRRVKANAVAAGRRNKTDQISAKEVAQYMISHPQKVTYADTDAYPTLRRQWSYIRMLSKQRTQLLNHLESILYTSMPEMLSFCKHGVPTWLLTVLSRFPTYQALHRAGVGKLSRIRYLELKKVEQILDRIKTGHGQSDAISGQIIRSVTQQIIDLDRLLAQQKKQLAKNYGEAQQEVELICSFPGIAVYSAVGLLINITDISRFESAKHLASFFGLHPIHRQSGDGSWGYRMSKQGRAEPRAILYMVCLSAIVHNPVIKELYARCLQKGMQKSAALGVCMHKTTRIIYGILTHQTPFDPEKYRTNKTTKHDSVETREPSTIRRLQDFDDQAPISKRQHKKRKEQASPQDDMNAKFGVKNAAPVVVDS